MMFSYRHVQIHGCKLIAMVAYALITNRVSIIKWSFHDYEATAPPAIDAALINRLTSWLLDTSLFRQAWAAVCSGLFNWWWSEQLCLYTAGAWTVFLATEGMSYLIFL